MRTKMAAQAFAAAAGLVLLASSALAGTIGYSVDSNGGHHLYAIDLSTGDALDLGRIAFEDAEGLSFYGGRLLAIGGSVDELWDITSPPGALIGATGARNGVDAGLDWDRASGILYNLNGGGGSSLYSIDPITGAATLIGSNAVFGDNVAVIGGVGYFVDGIFTDSLYTLDLATGAATLVGGLGIGDVSMQSGTAWDGSTLWLMNGSGQIYTINTATGAATFAAQTHVGATVLTGFEGLAVSTSSVPLPSSAWMGLGALGFAGIATRLRRRRSATVV